MVAFWNPDGLVCSGRLGVGGDEAPIHLKSVLAIAESAFLKNAEVEIVRFVA